MTIISALPVPPQVFCHLHVHFSHLNKGHAAAGETRIPLPKWKGSGKQHRAQEPVGMGTGDVRPGRQDRAPAGSRTGGGPDAELHTD